MNTIMLSQNKYRCRLCLKVSSDVINIFREDFPKMIKLLTTIQVDQNDHFPKVACIICTKRVKSAMNMRKQIIRSHRTLMEEAIAKTSQHNVANKTIISNKNAETETKVSSPEIMLLKVEDNVVEIKEDDVVEIKEDVIIIDSPTPESVPTETSTEPKKKNIQELQESLNKNEISIVKINKPKCPDPKVRLRGLVLQPKTNLHILKRRAFNTNRANLNSKSLINSTVPPVRRNVKMNFTPAIKVEAPIRRVPNPRPSGSKYDPLTPVPCKICQKVVQKTNMKKHLETHDDKLVTCHLCGKVTKSTSLRAHIFYFHKCKEDQYVCDQCGRHFRYRSKFKLHMKKEHGGTKDFECDICGRKFFERKYLKKHIDSHHNKIRPYICDYCGKDFSAKHGLRVHFRQHTESAPYSCDTCGQCFKQKVSLKTHRKQAHNICEEETIFCEVCGKGFASKVALASHSRLHERKKCPHCSEFFVREDYLERHIREKHETPSLDTENEEQTVSTNTNQNESKADEIST